MWKSAFLKQGATAVAACSVLALMSCGREHDLPYYKTGLWKVSIRSTAASASKEETTVEYCVDDKTQLAMQRANDGTIIGICPIRDISVSGDSVKTDSVCRFNAMGNRGVTKGHAEIKFPDDVSFTSEISAHTESTLMSTSDDKYYRSGKWISESCKSGMKPGTSQMSGWGSYTDDARRVNDLTIAEKEFPDSPEAKQDWQKVEKP